MPQAPLRGVKSCRRCKRQANSRRRNLAKMSLKPVELAVRAMQYSSRPGEHVLDLFGGSGTTLIAAEQTGRRALLMELDPLNCDVIVQRRELFTGRKAERISVGAALA
ncbi:MAG: DNA methyltransferase [Phycisphaerae bacterium]